MVSKNVNLKLQSKNWKININNNDAMTLLDYFDQIS